MAANASELPPQREDCFRREKMNNDSRKTPEKTAEGKPVSVKRRTLSCIFRSAVSAQDLRCFDMEKEKEDGSSPRGVIEACIRGLDAETDCSKTNSSDSVTGSPISHAPSRWHRFFKLWRKNSIKRLPSFPPLAVPKIHRRKSQIVRESVETGLHHIKSSWKTFTLHELETATYKFSQENLIGRGGYSEVYKGSLPDGQLVAIKRLTKGTQEEQTIAFLSEIGIIAHVNHPNTAKMIGYGVEGGTFLVLQLSQVGSLGSLLHESNQHLDWSVRYKIILGIADGLLYLHENCQRRIIHRDIKADNILLTEYFEPQICDFGLAKWLPKHWTHHNVSKFEGTFGYFAPEYFMHGIVDEKTDVFSFGVLLLELITGRRALDDSQQSLVLWAKPLLDDNDVKQLVDPSLGDNYDSEEMDRVILTASLCVEQTPILRPQMSQVMVLLRGNEYYTECSEESPKRSFQRTYSEELLDAEEYNSTKYLRGSQSTYADCFGSSENIS